MCEAYSKLYDDNSLDPYCKAIGATMLSGLLTQSLGQLSSNDMFHGVSRSNEERSFASWTKLKLRLPHTPWAAERWSRNASKLTAHNMRLFRPLRCDFSDDLQAKEKQHDDDDDENGRDDDSDEYDDDEDDSDGGSLPTWSDVIELESHTNDWRAHTGSWHKDKVQSLL